MNEGLKIFFDNPMTFTPENIRALTGISGLYVIYIESIDFKYPFQHPKLLFIVMSEKKTNCFGRILLGNFDGKSKNVG